MSRRTLKILFLPGSSSKPKLERSNRITNMSFALRTMDIQLYECCSSSLLQNRFFIYKRLKCIIDCFKEIQTRKPEGILASDTMAGFIGAVFKIFSRLQKHKIVFIYDSHGVVTREFPIHMVIEDIFASFIADCVVAVTPYDRNLYYSRFRKKVFVIPSFVNINAISFKQFSERSIDFAFHASFTYPPNREALKVVLALAKHLPQYQFVIFGSGLDNVNPISPNVKILGYIEDPFTILSNTKFYLAPILRGRGIITKVLDAMACGAVPIVTDFIARGIPELNMFKELIIADNLRSFYSKVYRVIRLDLDLLNNIGKTLQQIVINKYSFKRNKLLLKKILEYCIHDD